MMHHKESLGNLLTLDSACNPPLQCQHLSPCCPVLRRRPPTVNRCTLEGFDLKPPGLHSSLSHPAVAPSLPHCHAEAVAILQSVALTLIIRVLHKVDESVMDATSLFTLIFYLGNLS